jgi:hypothetical protein
MPKSCPSEDLFAAASDGCRPCRKPLFALWILLVPALGCASLLYGTQAKFGKIVCRSFQTGPASDCRNHAEHRAVQLREIETAHANVLYWTRRCLEDGPHEDGPHEDRPHQAADRVKLAGWKRGYQQRLALFARMYSCSHPKTPHD